MPETTMDQSAAIGPMQQFRRFLAEGRFMLQRSRRTGQCFFYPRVCEPATGESDLEWIEASGEGRVHATTVMRPKPPQAPYNVALIDLAEGPRMMSRVEGVAPEQVAIGMDVVASIAREGEESIVVFRPAS